MNNERNQLSAYPEISIIIPFKNNADELTVMLEAIAAQNYLQDAIEIICVDNGSDPAPKSDQILEAGRNIVLLAEANHPDSPYSARNRGVERSDAEILVFVDANSIPDKNWLREGVRQIQKTGTDIVAGRVNFLFENPRSGAEHVDALTSIHQKRAVEERGVAYTANLFVRKDIFLRSGLFEEGVRSGGDVRWTTKAVSGGAVIVYCDESAVNKYARTAKQLYKKRVRTGSGYYHTWKGESDRKKWWFNFLRSLKPPSPGKLRSAYVERYGEPPGAPLFSVWFFYYSSSVTEQLAFLKEYFLRHNSEEK